MYFIIIEGAFRPKARSNVLYKTRLEAETEVFLLNLNSNSIFRVGDADHYPDKQILKETY